MNLLFTINRSYYPILLNCLHSIIRQDHQEDLNVYIMHQGLSEDEEFELNVVFNQHDVNFNLIELEDKYLHDFPSNNRYPKMMYSRLFAYEKLPEEMDRILYLDPDTIILKPLTTLYHMDFKGHLFIGCSHIGEILTKFNQQRLDAAEDAHYINTGVLVMNLKKIRQEVKRADVLEYISKKEKLLYLPDQDVLSALYGHKALLVDSRIYNLSDTVLALENMKLNTDFISQKWIEENTVIIHYIGKNKPWNANYLGVLGKYYNQVIEEIS